MTVRIRELMPKIRIDAISVGSRAMHTRCMIFCVVSGPVMWGAAVTMSLLPITFSLRSSS